MEDYLIKGTIEHIHNIGGFDSMRIVAMEPGRVVVKSKAHQGFENIYENVHGGAIMTLIDMTASAAGYTTGKHVITLSSNTNFIRPLPTGDYDMKIVSEVVHNGRATIIVETKIFDARGKECARNTSTMFVPKTVGPDDEILVSPGSYDSDFREEGE